MQHLLFFITGGILNRVRGMAWKDKTLPKRVALFFGRHFDLRVATELKIEDFAIAALKTIDKVNRILQPVFYAIACAYVAMHHNIFDGHPPLGGGSHGLVIDAIKAIDLPAALAGCLYGLIGGLLMWLGQSPGWGAYVGTIHRNWLPHPEQKWIDWIIKPLDGKPFLWGLAGLSIRGLFWGALLAVHVGSIWPAVVGVSMGIFYAGCAEIITRLKLNLDGWGFAEVVFGAFLWLACSIGLQS